MMCKVDIVEARIKKYQKLSTQLDNRLKEVSSRIKDLRVKVRRKVRFLTQDLGFLKVQAESLVVLGWDYNHITYKRGKENDWFYIEKKDGTRLSGYVIYRITPEKNRYQFHLFSIERHTCSKSFLIKTEWGSAPTPKPTTSLLSILASQGISLQGLLDESKDLKKRDTRFYLYKRGRGWHNVSDFELILKRKKHKLKEVMLGYWYCDGEKIFKQLNVESKKVW